MAASPLAHLSAEVRLPKSREMGYDIIVGARNDASKNVTIRRQYEDFEQLHAKIGKPKRLILPKKGNPSPADLRDQLAAYLRAVLSDASLPSFKHEVRDFLEAALVEQFLSKLNELEQFNNLNVQLKDDELRRTREELVEARADLESARAQLYSGGGAWQERLHDAEARAEEAEARAVKAEEQLRSVEADLTQLREAAARSSARPREAQLQSQGQAASNELEAKRIVESLRAELKEVKAKLALATTSSRDGKVVEQAAAAAMEAVMLREQAERRAVEADARAAQAMEDVAVLTERAAEAEARVAQAEARLEARGDKASRAAAEAAQELVRAEALVRKMEERVTASELAMLAMQSELRDALAARAALEQQARPSITSLLPSPQDAIRSMLVAVAATSITPGGWWVFHVAVTCAGVSYTVRRRYREFYFLHSELSVGSSHPPTFPRKYSTRTQDAKFAEKRRQELDAYIYKLATSENRYRPELHSFLELGILLGGDGSGQAHMHSATSHSRTSCLASPSTTSPLNGSHANPFDSASSSAPVESPPDSSTPSTRGTAEALTSCHSSSSVAQSRQCESIPRRQTVPSSRGNPFGSVSDGSASTNSGRLASITGDHTRIATAAMPAGARSTNPF